MIVELSFPCKIDVDWTPSNQMHMSMCEFHTSNAAMYRTSPNDETIFEAGQLDFLGCF
jgi:hypothetical protein